MDHRAACGHGQSGREKSPGGGAAAMTLSGKPSAVWDAVVLLGSESEVRSAHGVPFTAT